MSCFEADGPALEILADAALMQRHRLEVPYSLRRDHQHRFPLTGTWHEREHAPGQDGRPGANPVLDAGGAQPENTVPGP